MMKKNTLNILKKTVSRNKKNIYEDNSHRCYKMDHQILKVVITRDIKIFESIYTQIKDKTKLYPILDFIGKVKLPLLKRWLKCIFYVIRNGSEYGNENGSEGDNFNFLYNKAVLLNCCIKADDYNNLRFLIEGNNLRENYSLEWSIENNFVEVTKYLINSGADINTGDGHPLITASINGDLTMVQYLVNNGASTLCQDCSAFRYAARFGLTRIIRYFLEEAPFENRPNIHAIDDWALRKAAKYGNTRIVIYLVSMGANVFARDEYALRKAKENNHFEIVKHLLDATCFFEKMNY